MTRHGTRSISRTVGVLGVTVAAIASTVMLPAPAGSDPAPAKLLGPVLSRVENAKTTLTRDGGFSTPVPGGRDFWVFADTPRYEFGGHRWKVKSVIPGSTAAMARFTQGKPLRNRLNEVRPKSVRKGTQQPARFLSAPVAYMPDGSGKRCATAKGGPRRCRCAGRPAPR